MTNILLISENFLRTNFNISDNVQSKFIIPAIRNAQTIKYQQVIGTKLYLKLLELVDNGTIDDKENAKYKELLDNSQLFIGYSAIVDLMIICNVKIDNIGVNITSDENVQTLQINDMFKMAEYYQNKADYYCKLVQGWILNNRDELPEISENICHMIHKNLYSAASCGIFLGGERGKNHNFKS